MSPTDDIVFTGNNLIFLVGAPRSGTTWLQRLLASHPRIKTGQESALFDYVGPLLHLWMQNMRAKGRVYGLPCYLTESEFLSIEKQHLTLLLKAMLKDVKPGDFFLEKTPKHALWTPAILQLLPQAKILHIVRDPRDVVASLLAASRGWASAWAPRRANDAARMWARHVRAVREAAINIPSGQFLEVRYEDLSQEPVPILQKVFSFLNVPWTIAEMTAAVEANAAEELRKEKGTPIPLHGEARKKSSNIVREPEQFVRKARPGSWREDLTLFERLRMTMVLRREMPDWKKFTRA